MVICEDVKMLPPLERDRHGHQNLCKPFREAMGPSPNSKYQDTTFESYVIAVHKCKFFLGNTVFLKLPYIIVLQRCGNRWDLPESVNVLFENLEVLRLLTRVWENP